MQMFATVKRIKVDTVVEDKFWKDSFTSGMSTLWGKEIQIVPSRGTSWYDGLGDSFGFVGYSFHKSWLKNIRVEND